MPTKKKAGPVFTELSLHVEGGLAGTVRAAFAKGSAAARRDAVIEAIKPLLAPGLLPAWLALSTDGLEDVMHLDVPLFLVHSADGDEFWSDPGRKYVVYKGKGKAESIDEEGETKSLTLAAKDLSKVSALQTGGEIVLTDLEWIEPAPKNVADLDRLLRSADHAVHGEMDFYDAGEILKKDEPAAPLPSGGPTAVFLGDPGRTSAFACEGPRKDPAIAWTTTPDSHTSGGEWGGAPVIAGDRLIASDESFNLFVAAVTLGGKQKLWEWKSSNQCWPVGGAIVAAGLYVTPTNRGLLALDVETGKQRWLAKIAGLSGSALAFGELVMVPTKKGPLAVSLANGRKKWAVAAAGVDTTPALDTASGLAFFQVKKSLLAIDAVTGKVRWKAPADEYSRPGPAASGGIVYWFDDKNLNAAGAATGKKTWSAKSERGDGIALACGGGTLLFQTGFEGLIAVDSASGRARWRFDFDGKPAIATKGGPVLALGGKPTAFLVMNQRTGGKDSTDWVTKLIALDLESGKLLWQKTCPEGDIGWKQLPVPLLDGALLAQTYQGIRAFK